MSCANCDECLFDIDKTVPTDLHEIHITVDQKYTGQFVKVCDANDIKAIVIAYGDSYLDPMTSHKFRGSIDRAKNEITRVTNILRDAVPSIPAIRIKAETTITNPVVLLDTGYFESHLGIQVQASDEPRLREFIRNTAPELHLSSNAMKTMGTTKTIMATYRDRNTPAASFAAEVGKYQKLLEGGSFTVDKQIVEYCWIDTNENHDDSWFSNT